MRPSYSVQASWDNFNGHTDPVAASAGRLYALSLDGDSYVLADDGPASVATEFQVRNDVDFAIAVTLLAEGIALIFQTGVANGQMAAFALQPPSSVSADASGELQVIVKNESDDAIDDVLVYQTNIAPSIQALSAAWAILRGLQPGDEQRFPSKPMPLYFGLVHGVTIAEFVSTATMNAALTEIDLSQAVGEVTVALTGSAGSGYTFELVINAPSR